MFGECVGYIGWTNSQNQRLANPGTQCTWSQFYFYNNIYFSLAFFFHTRFVRCLELNKEHTIACNWI